MKRKAVDCDRGEQVALDSIQDYERGTFGKAVAVNGKMEWFKKKKKGVLLQQCFNLQLKWLAKQENDQPVQSHITVTHICHCNHKLL